MKKLILLFIIALFGCSKGPDQKNLKLEVQAKLESFRPSLFSIEDFTRRGSYTYTGDGPNLLVYYKMQLKLLSNYKFNNWEQLGAGSLLTLLGSRRGLARREPRGSQREARTSSRGCKAKSAWLGRVAVRP